MYVYYFMHKLKLISYYFNYIFTTYTLRFLTDFLCFDCQINLFKIMYQLVV